MLTTRVTTSQPTMLRRLAHLLDTADMDLGGLYQGSVAAGVGIWLALPFNTLGSNPSLAPMLLALPENVWALIFLAIGLAEIAGVLLADASGDHRIWRGASLAIMVLWTFILAMQLKGNPVGIGLPLYVFLILLSFNQYRRLVRECRRGR